MNGSDVLGIVRHAPSPEARRGDPVQARVPRPSETLLQSGDKGLLGILHHRVMPPFPIADLVTSRSVELQIRLEFWTGLVRRHSLSPCLMKHRSDSLLLGFGYGKLQLRGLQSSASSVSQCWLCSSHFADCTSTNCRSTSSYAVFFGLRVRSSHPGGPLGRGRNLACHQFGSHARQSGLWASDLAYRRSSGGRRLVAIDRLLCRRHEGISPRKCSRLHPSRLERVGGGARVQRLFLAS
ncbi:hypothetical protein Taro_002162 [Colocasia esculenta]|uniref:Uncharacterized protein n=1 Tax=Colocasia esculenta TaxID=4460 RepID=A0A843TKV7_COLES|nr:hypothetical protein [Colocasia esculenta]